MSILSWNSNNKWRFDALKCDMSDRCNASVQAAARIASLFFLFNTSYISKNMHEHQRYERYSTTYRNVSCLM